MRYLRQHLALEGRACLADTASEGEYRAANNVSRPDSYIAQCQSV